MAFNLLGQKITVWGIRNEKYPIPEGFEETSWTNDACPSYTGFDGKMIIWIGDYDTTLDIYGYKYPYMFRYPIAVQSSHMADTPEGIYGRTHADTPDMKYQFAKDWHEVKQIIKDFERGEDGSC